MLSKQKQFEMYHQMECDLPYTESLRFRNIYGTYKILTSLFLTSKYINMFIKVIDQQNDFNL